MSDFQFPFTAVVGQTTLKQALLLNAVDPLIGGVVIRGTRGMAKTTLTRALAALLPDGRFVTLPLGCSEERLLGSLNLEKALSESQVTFQAGLLSLAHRGVLYVDEVNLLNDHLVDLLLDVAASGENIVERDGVSHRHPARFVLIGTMNPEEGELRPQLLDRFGLSVTVNEMPSKTERLEIVQRRLAFDDDPRQFAGRYQNQQQELAKHIINAQRRLREVTVEPSLQEFIADYCQSSHIEGVRGDLVVYRAARALAALEQQSQTTRAHVENVLELALAHRRKTPPAPKTPDQTQQQPHPQDDKQSPTDPEPNQETFWGELPPRPVQLGKLRNAESLLEKKNSESHGMNSSPGAKATR